MTSFSPGGFVPDAAAIRATVDAYVQGNAARSVDAIVDCFAEDATVEDPVGSTPHVGKDAIRAFFSSVPQPITIELVTARVADNVAAFLLSAVVESGGAKLRVEPIDFMTFDENAKIKTMRAVWSRDEVRPA